MQHSSQQQPNASLRAGTARRAGPQSVVTPPSTPNIFPLYDSEMRRAIRPSRRFDARLNRSAAHVTGCKVVVGMPEAAVNEELTRGNAMFEASCRGGKDHLTCNEGVTGSSPVEGSRPYCLS